jgi:hypothetical protein
MIHVAATRFAEHLKVQADHQHGQYDFTVRVLGSSPSHPRRAISSLNAPAKGASGESVPALAL